MDILHRGSQGPAVLQLQQALGAWGAALADPPGVYGLWTEVTICLLQRCAGLSIDGTVGPYTQALLEAAPAPPEGFVPRAAAPLIVVPGVPYRSQRDNVHSPATTCNVTALAMGLLALGVRPDLPAEQFEDEIFEVLHSQAALDYYRAVHPDLFERGFPVNEVHDNLAWAARRYGVPASFAEDRTLDDMRAEIAGGRPVLLSGLFTGTGHIVLLIGMSADGDLICHDPFGDWNSSYASADGAARLYLRERVLPILKAVDAVPKWGLFFRS